MPVKTLSGIQSIVQRGLAAAEDVFAQLDTPSEVDRGTTPMGRARGFIEIENSELSVSWRGNSGAQKRIISDCPWRDRGIGGALWQWQRRRSHSSYYSGFTRRMQAKSG